VFVYADKLEFSTWSSSSIPINTETYRITECAVDQSAAPVMRGFPRPLIVSGEAVRDPNEAALVSVTSRDWGLFNYRCTPEV